VKHTALLLCVACFGCAAGPFARGESVSDGRFVMGTVLEITLDGVSPRSAPKTFDELFAHAARLDRLMTRFDSKSEISRLNRAAGQGPQTVDPAVWNLLWRSVGFTRLTRGTFDVTVGPLVELWIDAAVADAPPTADDLDRARSRVGSDAIPSFSNATAGRAPTAMLALLAPRQYRAPAASAA
jgi:thiamine biosynthesis lipoprotein